MGGVALRCAVADSRVCIQCKEAHPLTEEHFHKSKDGFHSRCKHCRNKLERGKRKHKRDRRLDQIEKGAIDLFLASAKIGGANVPHSSELLEVLMEYFGGARGFGNAFMKQFFASPPGGAFRTKMLETVVRLVSANTAMGGAQKPLTHWTEEELEAELKQRLLEAATIINPLRIEHGRSVSGVPVVEPEGGRDGDLPSLSADARGVAEHGQH